MRITVDDVHGCYDELVSLLYDKYSMFKEDEVYFVGDLISKGPDNCKVTQFLINLTN